MLNRLIAKGDYVAIENGLLVLMPASGRPVPKEWIESEGEKLIKDILEFTVSTAYRFTHHTTAVEPKYSSDRLTLWFVSISSGCEVLTHFNVDITRQRNGTKNKAGTKLPTGKFIPRKQSKFPQWWKALNLPKPRYASEYHEKLRLLKPLLFSGETEIAKNHQIRFKDKNIELLSIDYERIKSSVISREEPVKYPCKSREEPVKYLREEITTPPVNTKATDDSECMPDLVRLKSDVTGATYRGGLPQEQTTDEWLADYIRRDEELLNQ